MHRKTWQNTWLPLHWILSPCVFNISLWSDSSRADLNTSLYGDQYVFIHTVIILFILMLEHWISCWKSEDSHTFFSHLDISDYGDIQILNKLLMSFPTSFFFFSFSPKADFSTSERNRMEELKWEDARTWLQSKEEKPISQPVWTARAVLAPWGEGKRQEKQGDGNTLTTLQMSTFVLRFCNEDLSKS